MEIHKRGLPVSYVKTHQTCKLQMCFFIVYLLKIITSIIKANKELKHYHQDVAPAYQSAMIEQPFNTKLNKLKKTNFEAFYYWYETYKLLQSI